MVDPDRHSALRRVVYRASLPAIPCGIALWLLGMDLDSYVGAVGGLLLLIAGAFAWQDDQNPAHPLQEAGEDGPAAP